MSKKLVILLGLFMIALIPFYHLKKIIDKPREILIIAHSNKIFNDKVLQAIAAELNIKLKMTIISDFADYETQLQQNIPNTLYWLPQDWANGFYDRQLLLNNFYIDSRTDEIHPDFLTTTQTNYFLPILWSYKDQALEIEGFSQTSHTSTSEVQNLIDFLMSSRGQFILLKYNSSFASTLKASEVLHVEAKQKPSYLREVQLSR